MGYWTPALEPRIVQPQEPVGIDWENPLTKSLVFSWVASRGLSIEQVTGTIPTSEAGITRSISKDSIGISASTSGTVGINYALTPFINTDKYTIAVVASPPAVATRTHLYFSGTEVSPFPQYILAANTNNTGAAASGKFALLEYDSGWKVQSESIAGMVDGGRHSFMAIRDGTTVRLLRDGIDVTGTLGTISGTRTSVSGNANVGGSVGAANRGGGFPIITVQAWTRVLSLTEALDYHRNPWQIQEQEEIEVWVPTSAGGSPTVVTLDPAAFNLTPQGTQNTLGTTLTASALNFTAQDVQNNVINNLTAAAFDFVAHDIAAENASTATVTLDTATFDFVANDNQNALYAELSAATCDFIANDAQPLTAHSLDVCAFDFVGQDTQNTLGLLLENAIFDFVTRPITAGDPLAPTTGRATNMMLMGVGN